MYLEINIYIDITYIIYIYIIYTSYVSNTCVYKFKSYFTNLHRLPTCQQRAAAAEDRTPGLVDPAPAQVSIQGLFKTYFAINLRVEKIYGKKKWHPWHISMGPDGNCIYLPTWMLVGFFDGFSMYRSVNIRYTRPYGIRILGPCWGVFWVPLPGGRLFGTVEGFMLILVVTGSKR